MKQTGKNINMHDIANTSSYSVGASTAVTILTVDTFPSNPQREVWVTNTGLRACWVRKYPAATDNNKTGVRLAPGDSKQVVMNSEVYYGEISAIMQAGGTATIHVENH